MSENDGDQRFDAGEHTDALTPFTIGRRRLLASLGLAGAMGLAGCSTNNSNNNNNNGGGNTGTTAGGATTTEHFTEKNTETQTPAPKEQIKMGGTFIGTFGADVKNYDPTQINDTTSGKATGLIYEELIDIDFQGKPVNNLAKSLEKQSDVKFRATLKDGIEFHNGDPLTAQDVKVSFERYKGKPRESDVYDWYDSSTVVDDKTIDIKLKRKYAPFKFALAGVPIVPKAAENGGVDLTKTPVGTGPYTFLKHKPDSFWRLQRNDNYWFEGNDVVPAKPPIKLLIFRVITEQSAQLAALRGDDVDFINDPLAGSVSKLKKNDKFTVTERVAGGFDMFVYPMHKKANTPFQNKKVRLGVNRLIPRQDIVKSVYNGIGIPAYAPISPLAGAFTSLDFQKEMAKKYAKYDRKQATQLLADGFKEAGFKKPFKTTIITNQNPQRVKWCQLIQKSMNATDFFKVDFNQFEWNTYVSKILAKDSHTKNNIVAVGWSAGWDPDAYVHNLFYSKQFTPACCNINHYQNDQVDKLIDQGLTTYDIDQRKQIYDELQRTIVKESPMAFIRFGKAMDAFASANVKGFATYPIDGGEYTGIDAPYANKVTWVDK